jgi:hypothetical protein
MFLLNLHFENTRLNGPGSIDFHWDETSIKKWTFLIDGEKSLELLKMTAISCIGKDFLAPLQSQIQTICPTGSPRSREVKLEFKKVRHPPRDCSAASLPIFASGLKIKADGQIEPFDKGDYKHNSPFVPIRQPDLGPGIRKNFALSYGPSWNYHRCSDCFDFSRANSRIVRFLSLFDQGALLTDPMEFLRRLHYRVIKAREPAILTMKLLAALFKEKFSIATGSWLDKKVDFREHWQRLNLQQEKLVVPIIDAVRHIMEASPHNLKPLEREGVIIFASPREYWRADMFTNWIEALDGLFPNIQFIVSSPGELIKKIPGDVSAKRLKVPAPPENNRPSPLPGPGRLKKGTVLLIDIDGRIPNPALMKLSTFMKKQGRNVVLVRHDKWCAANAADVDEIYASCIFNFDNSLRRMERLRKRFGDRLTSGGSGVNLKRRLPDEIERLPADYDLYPGLADRAIGFLTRGCPGKCPYCIVPEKEGLPKQVSSLDDLLRGRQKLILLDDNILAHEKADALLGEMAVKGIQVNFNQTLDIRFVDKERARLLKKIRCSNYNFTRGNYYFSLNGIDNLELVRRNYELFDFRHRKDNVQFVCMYGYNTTLEEDVERFRFLRTLPGAYVFVQEYKPIIGREKPGQQRFFNDRADELIDRLIRIIFPQNMKSMEQYYRWLSQLYYTSFGKPHNGLVDTIFRYNHRDRKSLYIAGLHGLRRRRWAGEFFLP